jgi:hypothetical protein
MNSKTLIGGLIAGIVGFLLGYLIYAVLLKDYFSSNMTHYDGLTKDPPVIWEIGVANLVMGLLLAYIFSMSGIKSVAKGLATGIVVSLLATLTFDLFMHAQMNLFDYSLLAIDVVLSAVLGGVSGAVLGWWMGRGTTAAAA